MKESIRLLVLAFPSLHEVPLSYTVTSKVHRSPGFLRSSGFPGSLDRETVSSPTFRFPGRHFARVSYQVLPGTSVPPWTYNRVQSRALFPPTTSPRTQGNIPTRDPRASRSSVPCSWDTIPTHNSRSSCVNRSLNSAPSPSSATTTRSSIPGTRSPKWFPQYGLHTSFLCSLSSP